MDSHDEENFASRNDSDSRAIRRLNDRLRIARKGGQLFVTKGICQMGEGIVPDIIKAVADFDDFSAENDPYGEHDFGALTVHGRRVCWKIDYYDAAMQGASPDPADEALTTRVLTIMLASEY